MVMNYKVQSFVQIFDSILAPIFPLLFFSLLLPFLFLVFLLPLHVFFEVHLTSRVAYNQSSCTNFSLRKHPNLALLFSVSPPPSHGPGFLAEFFCFLFLQVFSLSSRQFSCHRRRNVGRWLLLVVARLHRRHDQLVAPRRCFHRAENKN